MMVRILLWLDTPVGRTVWLPLLVAIVATGILRLAWAREKGPILANAAAGAAFVLTYAVTAGLPGIPTAGAAHKIFYLSVAGLVLGAILDAEEWGTWMRRVVVVVLPLLGLVWIAGPLANTPGPPPDQNLVLGLFAAAVIVLLRLTRTEGSALTAPVHLAVASAGLAAVALYAGTFFAVQVGTALAAATVGFLVWNWPVYRYPPGGALLLAIGMPALALAAQLLLYDGAPWGALAVLLLVFFSDWIAGGIRLGGGRVAYAVRPLLTAVVGALVVAASGLVAYLQSAAVPPPP